jgi:hypothetical protein
MTKAMRTVKKGVIPAAQVFSEARKRPGYAEAYDALEEEFSLVTAFIKPERMRASPRRNWPSA